MKDDPLEIYRDEFRDRMKHGKPIRLEQLLLWMDEVNHRIYQLEKEQQ